MNIAFTICSNNYLARAKVVADSFTLHHPDSRFFIFLVDKLDPQLDYNIFSNCTIVEIHTVVPDIEELAKKYNIIELNTAVKPAAFLYLFKNFSPGSVTYLDPDLQIFSKFDEVLNALDTSNIIITPHFCSPIDDGKFPSDVDFIPYGVYNLGYITVKNSMETTRFLKWWHDRLMKYCYMRPDKGMFTDQLWINYAPAFFEGVYILKHLGYNVAGWNLFERQIHLSKGGHYVNEITKLRFFHFSHYQFSDPYIISKHQTRHTIQERQDIKQLIDNYHQKLIDNNYLHYVKSKCYYQLIYQQYQQEIKRVEMATYTFRWKLKRKLGLLFNSINPR